MALTQSQRRVLRPFNRSVRDGMDFVRAGWNMPSTFAADLAAVLRSSEFPYAYGERCWFKPVLRGLRLPHRNADAFLEAFAPHWPMLPDLREIEGWFRPVTDAGLAYLAGLTSLQRLNLACNSLTDAGLVHIAGLADLRELNLSHTQVADAGLVHFAGLKALRDVDLSYTQVTGPGLIHLAGLPTLRTLNLRGASLVPGWIANLPERPTLRILTWESGWRVLTP